MKKLLSILFLAAFFVSFAYADRNTITTGNYSSSELIKRGDTKVYSLEFIATGNGGSFALYDALNPTVSSTIKAEGMEATVNNGKPYNWSDKPLEFSTGLYLEINAGYVVIRYE